MNNKKDTRYMVTLALMAAIVILLANTRGRSFSGRSFRDLLYDQ